MTLLGRRPVTFGALLAMALAVSTCGGNSPPGSLLVTVVDLSGAPVINATVTTVPPTQALVTDTLGTTFLAKVPPGGYAVTASHPTAGAGRVAVEVKANDVAKAVVALSPGVVLPTGTAGAAGSGRGAGGSVAGTGGRGGATALGSGGAGRGGAAALGSGGAGVGGATGGGSPTAIMLAVPTKDSNGVNLGWTVAPGNSFATYRVYRNGAVINILQDGASVQYRDESGQLGVVYSYQIGGLTAAGAEVRSNTQMIAAGVYIDVGSQIEGLMVDPKRPYIYGIDKVNNSLHFINLTTNTVEKTIFVGSSPSDLDINLQGTTLYVANFGGTQIATVDLDTRVMSGALVVDTTVGTWDGNPYRIACTAGDTLVFTSMDQWNDLKLVDALTGAALDHTGSVYEPDLVASPDGTRLYVGEQGGLNGVTRYDIVSKKLQQVDSSPSTGGAHVLASKDGKYVFYSTQKILANNLKSVLGTFSEPILAINQDGSVAIGAKSIYDGTTFAVKRATPLMTSTLTVGPDGATLYLYDTMSSRIYLYRLQ